MPHRWNKIATLRRQQIEQDLDITFSKVFVPWYKELLRNRRPMTLLEVGAGTGHLSLALQEFPISITAVEPSLGMFQIASEVLAGQSVNLRNILVEDLEVDRYFELVISHMCVHTVQDVNLFMRGIARHVAPSGAMVISIPHPLFYNDYKKLFPKGDYNYMREQYREISFSITLDPEHPIEGVPYYHRPISHYMRSISGAGFLLEDLVEIFPSEEIQRSYGALWNGPRYLVLIATRRAE